MNSSAEKLQLHVSNHSHLVEAAPIGLMSVDVEGRIVIVNRQIESMFGYSRAELLGQPVETLLPAELRQEHPQLRRSYLENPTERRMGSGRTLRGRRKDGSEFPIEIALNPGRGADVSMIHCSVFDATERIKQEIILHARLRELQYHRAITTQLIEMTSLLQHAIASSEIYEILTLFGERILNATPVGVYVQEEDGAYVSLACRWNHFSAETSFDGLRCWAIRRGVMHRSGALSREILCRHSAAATPDTAQDTTCIPLSVNHRCVGVMVILFPSGFDEAEPGAHGEHRAGDHGAGRHRPEPAPAPQPA